MGFITHLPGCGLGFLWVRFLGPWSLTEPGPLASAQVCQQVEAGRLSAQGSVHFQQAVGISSCVGRVSFSCGMQRAGGGAWRGVTA
jgi:hypothetical protein